MKIVLKIILILVFLIIIIFSILTYQQTQKSMNTNNINKAEETIYIHKIAGLGDEVADSRTYEQACQEPQEYLNKRYKEILKFELLPSNYTEGNKGAIGAIQRYTASEGGQYSCYFKGTYLKSFTEPKILNVKSFAMSEISGVSFNYPQIEGFELKQNYNAEKKAGEIIYFAQKNVIAEAVPFSSPVIHRHPMLIIQKMDSKTPDYSVDKISVSPSGVKYKIWDEHDVNSNYLDDPYDNLDTTIEFQISDKEIYLVSTVNFIYNGIAQQPVLNTIAESFRIPK